MIQVTKERFYHFLRDRVYYVTDGEWFHSKYFVCPGTGEKIAYLETSSWGAPDVYKIESRDENEGNYTTIEFISGKFLIIFH